MAFCDIISSIFSIISIAIVVFIFSGICLCLKFIYRRIKLSHSLPSTKHAFYDFLGIASFIISKPGALTSPKLISAGAMQVFMGLFYLFQDKQFLCTWVGYRPLIMIANSQSAEKILSGTKFMHKGFIYKFLHPWLGIGLLTSTGNKWKSRRRLLTPAFHFEILRDFFPVFNEKAEIMVKVLRQEAEKPWIDITKHAISCSLDIICETTFGVNVNAQEKSDSEYVQAVHRATVTVIQRIFFMKYWVDYLFYFTKLGRQFRNDVKMLHDFTKKVIREKKEKALKEGFEAQPKRKALMDLLIEQHIKNQTLSEEDIQEEVDTFAFEGHDTTSMGITWALYMIGLHKDVQNKLHDEIQSIFGDDLVSSITNEDLNRMKYLGCVLKETQRLYPSVPAIAREIDSDLYIDGYRIPAGCYAIIFMYQLHRDKNYFPDPEKFDPDRFLPENMQKRHPFAFLPFSAGPRNCIGQKFALMEEKVVIASILRNFYLESLDSRDKVEPCLDLILRSKEPIRIKFIPKT